MSFSYLVETKELSESTRKGAPGSFVALTDGVTHYELGDSSHLPEGKLLESVLKSTTKDTKGHEDLRKQRENLRKSVQSVAESRPGERVNQELTDFRNTLLGVTAGSRDIVLVHGFSVPYFIFDPTFEFLCKSGYRVLRYDLFGRGFSDRPNVNYDIHLFVRQLADLLEALHFGAVSLVGLSLGGPITAAFSVQHPERVYKHVLIDPAGAKAWSLSEALKEMITPPIRNLAFGPFRGGSRTKSRASDAAILKEFFPRYRIQMQYKGFKRAILSTMRNGMLDSFYETYERVGKLNKPTLLFWGCNDPTVPFYHSALIQAAIPHVQFHAIEDCGHIPHYEKPDIVNPILREFLES